MAPTIRWGGKPIPGLPFIHEGKVRESYGIPQDPGLRLVVASNRISVFDFVLNAEVPRKGEVLTAMNVFWRNLFAGYCNHDLVAYGSAIDQSLPLHLRSNIELQKCGAVIRAENMYSAEMIVRAYLTGTGFLSYQDTGMVCGHDLPRGLQDGARLPLPIFTPTTKADVGHDEHVTIEAFYRRFGNAQAKQLEVLSLDLFRKAREYAASRGIIIADTKFEFGKPLTLCDEVLTPDSSRFWKYSEWEAAQAQGKVPPAYDKQFVRNWARGYCIHKLNPKNPRDYDRVRARVVPQEILEETTRLYLEIFQLLTGKSLEQFQREDMGIAI